MAARILAMITVALITVALGAAAQTPDVPAISVREAGGVFMVSARFTVAEPGFLVREVLTDYANIPRYMPDVRSSEVLERQEGYARVRQVAVSKYLLFSKRVHLVLDIDEGVSAIRFRDRCSQSFVQYEGAWRIVDHATVTEIRYELTAQPAFSVPGFVLRKLLDRDAGVMIERLRSEIAARAAR